MQQEAHPRRLRGIQPAVGLEVSRIELLGEALVLVASDVAAPQDLLVPGGDGVDTPVDEHAEAFGEVAIAAIAVGFDHGWVWVVIDAIRSSGRAGRRHPPPVLGSTFGSAAIVRHLPHAKHERPRLDARADLYRSKALRLSPLALFRTDRCRRSR